MKQFTEYAPKTEKTPNYKLRRAVAVGAITTTAAFGIYKATDSAPDAPASPHYLTAERTLELGEGDTVLGAAINGARDIQPDLSLEDQSYITEQAQQIDKADGVVQPGYEVSVRYGEFDGQKDANGNLGTDFEVKVSPNVIK